MKLVFLGLVLFRLRVFSLGRFVSFLFKEMIVWWFDHYGLNWNLPLWIEWNRANCVDRMSKIAFWAVLIKIFNFNVCITVSAIIALRSLSESHV
jgi:hypothetical protein